MSVLNFFANPSTRRLLALARPATTPPKVSAVRSHALIRAPLTWARVLVWTRGLHSLRVQVVQQALVALVRHFWDEQWMGAESALLLFRANISSPN